MTNDPTLNPFTKNQAIAEIVHKKQEIMRLQAQFGITDADLEQAANSPSENPPPSALENSTYEHGKKVGSWLKNVLK